MDARPSGWYDDPDDSSRLRYWDGVVWTERTAEKAPMPAPQPPREPTTKRPTRESSPRRSDTPPPGPGRQTAPQPGPQAGLPRGPQPGPQRGPGPLTGPDGRPIRRTHADDGTPLSGFWRRALALVVDYLLVVLLVSLAVAPFLGDARDLVLAWYQGFATSVQEGTRPPEMPAALVRTAGTITLLEALALLAYEVLCVSRWGATLGRRLTGIVVRSSATGERPDQAALIRRTFVKWLAVMVASMPLLGQLAAAFTAVDWLWPLADPQRRALHDKVGGTEVVRRVRP